MGSSQSKPDTEGEGHGKLFELGVKAAKEGRYCVSEISFQEALCKHPGRNFWVTLCHGMSDQAKPAAEGEDGSAPVRDRLTAHLNINEKGRMELPLSFDNEAVEVMDYMRLCTDIANVYLTLPRDSMNASLAMSYFASTHVSVQLFFLLQGIWLMESGDGFLKGKDDDGTADVETAGFNLERIAHVTNEYVQDPNAETTPQRRFGNRHATRAEIMSELLKTFHTTRYYYEISGICFIMIVIYYCGQMDRTKDKKKIKRALTNCSDILGQFQYNIKFNTQLQPDSSLKRVVEAYLPPVDFVAFPEVEGELSDETSEAGGNKGASAGKNGVNNSSVDASVTAMKLGGQAFLYQAKFPNPAAKITVEFMTNPPMRLKICSTTVRHKLCDMDCAVHRDAYRLFTCFFADRVSFFPGFAHRFLTEELPYYKTYCDSHGSDGGKAHTASTGFSVMPREDSAGKLIAKAKKKEPEAEGVVMWDTDPSLKEGAKAATKTPTAPWNAGLNLRDPRTIQAVDYEESLIFGCVAMLLLAQINGMAGHVERQKALKLFVRKTAETLYGLDSEEYVFFSTLNDNADILF